MLDGNLIAELQELGKQMDEACEEMKKRGIELADAERKYTIKLRQKALIEKDSGIPVTFINNFIKGDPEVAELRFKRNEAETLYNVAVTKANNLRQELKVVNAQAQREWAASGRNVPDSSETSFLE